MKLVYKKSIFFLYSVLLFFTPLIVFPYTVESFEFPKMFFIYLISNLIVILYTLFSSIDKNTFVKGNFFKPLIPYFVFSVISLFFSNDIYTSMWGYYSRFNGGLYSLITFVLLGWIAFRVFDKDEYLNLFLYSLLSVTFVSLNGFFQSISSPELPRIYGTLGQPNWLGQYLGVFYPLLLIVLLSTNYSLKDYKLYILLLIYSLIFYSIWSTFSLSTFLGILISIPFVYISIKDTFKITNFLIVSFLSILVMFSNFGFFTQRLLDMNIDIKKFLQVSTSYDIVNSATIKDTYSVSDPGFIRSVTWKSSLKMVLENPIVFLFGRGLQTYPYEYQAYRPVLLNYTSEWDYLVNRPHNYYIELFVEIGFLGLVGYLYLINFLFVNSPKVFKPSLIVFLVTNIFSWPVTVTSLLFWFYYSYIIKIYSESF